MVLTRNGLGSSFICCNKDGSIMEKRNLDIGYSVFGEEAYGKRGTTIGLDPEPIDTEWQEMTGLPPRKPSFPEIMGRAESLPFASNSLDRVTSVILLDHMFHMMRVY